MTIAGVATRNGRTAAARPLATSPPRALSAKSSTTSAFASVWSTSSGRSAGGIAESQRLAADLPCFQYLVPHERTNSVRTAGSMICFFGLDPGRRMSEKAIATREESLGRLRGLQGVVRMSDRFATERAAPSGKTAPRRRRGEGRVRLEMLSQRLEKTDSAPGNGAPGRAGPRDGSVRPAAFSRPGSARPPSPFRACGVAGFGAQAIEKVESPTDSRRGESQPFLANGGGGR